MNFIFSPSEVVTRLSEVCCQQVVDDGALPVIFKVLKKCNRSLPHLEVIKYSVLILYNVVKVGKFVLVMLSHFLSSLTLHNTGITRNVFKPDPICCRGSCLSRPFYFDVD